MAFTTLVSGTVGVVGGRIAHASVVKDAKGEATAAATGAVILAMGELASFAIEDTTTLYIYAQLPEMYNTATNLNSTATSSSSSNATAPALADRLNLLVTVVSSVVVAVLMLYGVGGLALDDRRKGGLDWGYGAGYFLLAALPTSLVGFFGYVAFAISEGGVAQFAGLPDALLAMYVVAWLVAWGLCTVVVEGVETDITARLSFAGAARFLACREMDPDDGISASV